MKTILFPTDFSPASNNAFVYALQFARHIGAKVVTLHVYEMPALDYVDVPAYLMEVYDTVELSTFENYKSQVPYLHQIAHSCGCDDVPIENVLLDGDLVNTILHMVKTDHIDFVVMGTKGASGSSGTFLGTNTTNVMTRTNALVLAVPEGSVYEPIKRITFTTRFREKDFPALKKLLPIAKAFGAAIDCLYVKTPGSDLKDVVLADWELLMKDEDVTFHIVENEDVEYNILEFIDTHKTDILALFNHKRGFFEGLFRTSMTRKLAFHAKVPVLAIHEND